MRGAESNYVPDSDLEKIKSMFLDAQIATIDKSGHWPHIDNTNVFMASLVKYLNEDPFKCDDCSCDTAK
jgi:pimeloyl-ACP methyl ester carboxylesterase